MKALLHSDKYLTQTKNNHKLFFMVGTAVLIVFLNILSSQLMAQGIILEAEEGELLGSNTSIENSAAGFSGSGYVTGFQESADGVKVTVDIETAGEYTISVGFSSPYGEKDNFISINDDIVDTVHFYELTGFSEVIAGDFQLNQGENSIGFHHYWGWCFLDYIKVSDISPRGDFTISPESPATGDTVTFDASGTYDPNGTIISYEWDFGDGSTGTGEVINHVYKSEGLKTITLLLTDNDNNTSQIINQVNVARAEPYAVFSWSSEFPEPGMVLDFNGSLSYDLTGTVDNWEWDFGDGTTASGETVSHTFAAEGNYEVTLTVTNNRGKSDTRKATLFVYATDVVLRGPSILTPTLVTNEKIEFEFQVKADYTNPYDPQQVKVDAIITPEGSSDSIVVPCFYYVASYFQQNNWKSDSTVQGWRLRYSTKTTGNYSVKLKYTGSGTYTSTPINFSVQQGTQKGIIQNDLNNPQYYRHSTGEPYYPMGINIGWNNITNYATILANITENNANLFRYWHTPFARQALEWSDNGFYSGLGIYSQEAAGMTDSLINLGKDLGACMQLVIFQHGPFSENVNPMWNENPYNSTNGGFVDQAEEYFYNDDCKVYTKKLLRYIVARWGYSPNIFAWEFFNEVQFTGNHPNQSAQWYEGIQQWHSDMSSYIESIDPFNHIMTTSAEHNQLYDFDSISKLDVVQYHLYSENLLSSQKNLDYTFKEELETPIINGEYGEDVSTADVPLNKQQISLWNSIMTEVPHLMWLWDNYHLEEWGKVFYYPTLLLENEDLSTVQGLKTVSFTASNNNDSFETTGIASDSCFYGVVYQPDAAFMQDVIIDNLELAYGYYDISYYLPSADKTIFVEDVPFIREQNSLTLPNASNDIAFKIKFKAQYNLPIALAGVDQQIPLGTSTQLDGSASFDPNGQSINYLWELYEKPSSSALSISNPDQAVIDISPDISGFYYFKLTVDNGSEYSVPDTVVVVASTRPIANAGLDVSVEPRRTVELDGTGSYDPDGETISYLWQIISKPTGASADVLNYTSATGLFRGDSLGEYRVTLIVDDGIQPSEPDTVIVTVAEKTSVSDVYTAQLLVFPNPAETDFKIKLNPGMEILKEVHVMDITGRSFINYMVPDYLNTYSHEITINLENNQPNSGLYFIRMNFENGYLVKSLLIK